MKKNISKFLTAIMVLSLILNLVACADKTSKYVGEWECTAASSKGVSIEPSAMNVNLSMILQAEGSATVTSDQGYGSGEWEETSTGIILTSDGSALTFTYKDGKLEMTEPQSGIVMTFEKKDK